MASARLIGIWGNVLVCIFVVVGTSTTHWVNFIENQGHAGLWQYCSLPESNDTLGNETIRQHFTTTTIENSEEDDEEEDECHNFDYDHDVYLHITRACMVIAVLCLAYGILSGKTLRKEVPYESRFLSRHSAECLILLNAALIFTAVAVHRNNFINDSIYGEFVKEDSSGWSSGISLAAAYLSLPVFILMVYRTVKDRWSCCTSSSTRGSTIDRLCTHFKHFGICRRLCHLKENRETSPSVEVTATQTGQTGASTDAPTNRHDGSETSSESSFNPDGTGPNLSWMDEDNDDIFTIRITNSTPMPTVTPESNTDPAPAYEDLTPRSDIPHVPPPSYEDVIGGNYTSPSSPSSSQPQLSPPPQPSAPPLPFSRPSHPPPSYDQSFEMSSLR